MACEAGLHGLNEPALADFATTSPRFQPPGVGQKATLT
jgi:hypothetical protein